MVAVVVVVVVVIVVVVVVVVWKEELFECKLFLTGIIFHCYYRPEPTGPASLRP